MCARARDSMWSADEAERDLLQRFDRDWLDAEAALTAHGSNRLHQGKSAVKRRSTPTSPSAARRAAPTKSMDRQGASTPAAQGNSSAACRQTSWSASAVQEGPAILAKLQRRIDELESQLAAVRCRWCVPVPRRRLPASSEHIRLSSWRPGGQDITYRSSR